MKATKLLEKILVKKAKGYTVKEKVDEYTVVDGSLTLVKRKISTKHVAPDVSAVKALLQMGDVQDNVQNLTDEQLQLEKLRLLNLLKLCEDVNDKSKEDSND